MARFFAEIQGNRGAATRLGGLGGIRARAQGWNVGVRIEGVADGDEDKFEIHATTGSGGRGYDVFLGTVRLDAEGQPTFTPA